MGISFFVAALSLLGISIYTVYSFLSVFFSASGIGKLIILIALILVSFGFLAMMILSRFSSNSIIHVVYIIFSLALGLLFYLTISAILFKLIQITGLKIDLLLFSRIGFSLAVILFTVGLYQAAFPVVKNISVNMAGLPSSWQGKKIVQLSDVHLGGFYGLGFLNKQIATVNSLNPDLIVITGDLFDGTENHLNSFGPVLAKLKAKEGVIFVPGNHDNYLGIDKIAPVLSQANILMLKDEAITINGLEIIGLDVHQLTGDDSDLVVKNLSSYSGQARLLLKHVPKDIAWAKYLNIELQLSGHSHNGQMFPLAILTKMFYGKYQYGLHTEGNFNIYTSSGLGSWGPPVRTFNPAEIVLITLN